MKHARRYKILPSRYPRIALNVVRHAGPSTARGVILFGWLFLGIERLRLSRGVETNLCWAWGLREIKKPSALFRS